MPKFFFDCYDGERHIVDDHGIELGAESDIRDQAVALAQSLLGDGPILDDARHVAVTVRARGGSVVYVAHCSFTGRWQTDRAPATAA